MPVILRIDGRSAKEVRIEIQNGGSMPDSIRGEPFAPFARSGTSSGGAGLGLFIVDQIARAHGGSASIDRHDASIVVSVRLARHHTTA